MPSADRYLTIALDLNNRGAILFDRENSDKLVAACRHFQAALKLLKRAIIKSREEGAGTSNSSVSSLGRCSTIHATHIATNPATMQFTSVHTSSRITSQQPDGQNSKPTDTRMPSSDLFVCATPLKLQRRCAIGSEIDPTRHDHVAVSQSEIPAATISYNLAVTLHLLSHQSEGDSQAQQQMYQTSAVGLYKIVLGLRPRRDRGATGTAIDVVVAATATTQERFPSMFLDVAILSNMAVLYLELGNRECARSCYCRLVAQINHLEGLRRGRAPAEIGIFVGNAVILGLILCQRRPAAAA